MRKRFMLVSTLAAAALVGGCSGGGDVCDHIVDKGFEGVSSTEECRAFVEDLRSDCSNGDEVLQCIGNAQDRDAYGACENLCQ